MVRTYFILRTYGATLQECYIGAYWMKKFLAIYRMNQRGQKCTFRKSLSFVIINLVYVALVGLMINTSMSTHTHTYLDP